MAQNLSKKFGLSILTCSPLSFDTSPLKISFGQSEGESNQILLGQAVHHHFCNDTVAIYVGLYDLLLLLTLVVRVKVITVNAVKSNSNRSECSKTYF